MKRAVIGIDPGPTTGLAFYTLDEGLVHPPAIVQCDVATVAPLIDAFAERGVETIIAIERFVVSTRAARGGNRAGGKEINHVTAFAESLVGDGVTLHANNAATVKEWATDKRLRAAGVPEKTTKMVDARDAARHGLYVMRTRGWACDPLSKRAREANEELAGYAHKYQGAA